MQHALLRSALVATAVVFGLAGCDTTTDPSDAGNEGQLCTNDSDCGAPELGCFGGLCTLKCLSDDDCPGGLCDFASGFCEDAPVDTPDAGPDQGTPDGGNPGKPDAGGPVSGGPCQTKYDCVDGEICRGSPRTCSAPRADGNCSADLDCPRGYICNFTQKCEPGCTDLEQNRDCDDPKLCHPQKFVCETCSLTNPCPAGKSCIGQQCVEQVGCSTTADCAAAQDGSVCRNGKCGNCESHVDCRTSPYQSENRVCTANGLCAKVSCTDSDCKTSMNSDKAYCNTATNQCAVRECLADSDCTSNANGPICDTVNHVCTSGVEGCNQTECNNQCAAQGLSCNLATCRCAGGGSGQFGDPCFDPSECSAGLTCALGICSDAAVLPGGAPCDMFSCIGGACVSAVDPSYTCTMMGCLMGMFGGGMGGGGGGGGGSGQMCLSDGECPAGEYCEGAFIFIPGQCVAGTGGGSMACL